MWRKTACAVGGLVVAGIAAYGLSSIDKQSSATNFDLRWLYPASKTDRLPILPMRPVAVDNVVMAFNVPSAKTTVATKGPTLTEVERRRMKEGFVDAGRGGQASSIRIRVIPVNPVRTVPNDEKQDRKGKDKLPIGCEPAFSPVTTPAMAHISSRCDA